MASSSSEVTVVNVDAWAAHPEQLAQLLGRAPTPCGHRGLAFIVNWQKANLMGVLEATVPSPRDRPQRQTYNRARSTKENTASQAARRDHAPQRPRLPPEQHEPSATRPDPLDTRHVLRHPGTGHGAGRRTGSTPTAGHAGP